MSANVIQGILLGNMFYFDTEFWTLCKSIGTWNHRLSKVSLIINIIFRCSGFQPFYLRTVQQLHASLKPSMC